MKLGNVTSLKQLKTYCKKFSVPDTEYRSSKRFNGIGGSHKSIGIARINIHFTDLGVGDEVDFRIIDVYILTI